jgi:hypothetical protein
MVCSAAACMQAVMAGQGTGCVVSCVQQPYEILSAPGSDTCPLWLAAAFLLHCPPLLHAALLPPSTPQCMTTRSTWTAAAPTTSWCLSTGEAAAGARWLLRVCGCVQEHCAYTPGAPCRPARHPAPDDCNSHCNRSLCSHMRHPCASAWSLIAAVYRSLPHTHMIAPPPALAPSSLTPTTLSTPPPPPPPGPPRTAPCARR